MSSFYNMRRCQYKLLDLFFVKLHELLLLLRKLLDPLLLNLLLGLQKLLLLLVLLRFDLVLIMIR
jgi:hypothetical protein